MSYYDRHCTKIDRSALSYFYFFFSSRRRHTRLQGDWSSDVCSSDLIGCEGHGSDRRARDPALPGARAHGASRDRKSTRLNSSHLVISYAVFCLKKKKKTYSLLPRPPYTN